MKRLLALMMVLLFSVVIVADVPQYLSEAKIKKFIKTFPGIDEEIQKLDIEFEDDDEQFKIPEAVKANHAVKGILKKHGWDENYWQVLKTIMVGYTSKIYNQEMSEAAPELSKALKELENNPAITEEMKAQMKKSFDEASAALKNNDEEIKKSIHPKDQSLVDQHFDEINQLFEDLDYEEED